jgi:ribosomal protein S13
MRFSKPTMTQMTQAISHARRFFTIATMLLGSALATQANASCSAEPVLRAQLESLKSNKWVMPDVAARQVLALDLLGCLGSSDPVLRDELAFEALSAWMRSKQLTNDTLHSINRQLQHILDTGAANHAGTASQHGFLLPFAALTLAEVARVDRLQAFLTEPELDQLVTSGVNYLQKVRDYRGFVEGEGWRHGVAHGADVMLQLSINPRLTRNHSDQILASIASQIAPSGDHFYKYREGERLMAPVFYLARRENITSLDWETWLGELVSTIKADAPASQVALARRHNLAGFLLPLYFSVQESGDARQRERLLPAVSKALKTLR